MAFTRCGKLNIRALQIAVDDIPDPVNKFRFIGMGTDGDTGFVLDALLPALQLRIRVVGDITCEGTCAHWLGRDVPEIGERATKRGKGNEESGGGRSLREERFNHGSAQEEETQGTDLLTKRTGP